MFCSIRRDGKTLGQMAREEVSARGGLIAQLAVLAIMVILLAVVALVVVNALKSSPWATFTLAMTIPIALLLGVYLRFIRPGRVLEASLFGVALVLFAVVAGQWVADRRRGRSASRSAAFRWPSLIIAYGFAAAVLPVWLLLAPRDYLSAFIKTGAIFSLAAGILLVRPQMHDAAADAIYRWNGPGFCGEDFSILLHHHCLRRDQRISFADFHRHHAENDSAREPFAVDRLRRDAAGVVCRRDGHGGGVCDAAGRLFCD